MQVALDGEQGGPPTASWYGRLRAQNPIELPGELKPLGMWVHGNSSWVRVAFELVDAEGEAWINIGAAKDDGRADWNTNVTESTTFVNFDGWREPASAGVRGIAGMKRPMDFGEAGRCHRIPV